MKGLSGSPRRTLPPEAAEVVGFEGLREHAMRFGVSLGPGETRLLRVYLSELLRWNQKFNLISVSTAEALLLHHVLDSLAPTPLLEGVRVLVDVGSGCGFPGIPIKIVRSSLRTYLLEARRKRVSFLQYVIARLGLEGIDALWGRLEAGSAAPGPVPEPADCILTRASGAEEAMLRASEQVLAAGGKIVLMKGSLDSREMVRWEHWAKGRGRRLESVRSYRLPGVSADRHLVVFC